MAHHHFEPESYPERVRSKVPQYEELEEALAGATETLAATRILDLGSGTGETARRVLEKHPLARAVLVDASAEMLEAARVALREDRIEEIVVRPLEDPLPDGPFDLVVSALAIHHLKSADKRLLFRRIAVALKPGGRFVLADVVVPDDPGRAVSSLDSPYDRPDRLDAQLGWIREAGLEPNVVWSSGDLVVVRCDRPLE
ncbi:MAG: class I SAM-dependent methyltransferase [Gaiellaceae bacterium]